MSKKLSDIFATQGYLALRGYFDLEALDAIEARIVDLYAMQARKIGEHRDRVIDMMSRPGTHTARLEAVLGMLEHGDQEAAYQVQKMVAHSKAARDIFSDDLTAFCARLCGGDRNTMLVEGPALFVNRPMSQRLLYKWHTEALYYPKRRRFVNVWFPLFGDRNARNGAMSVLPGSHRQHWDISCVAEYTGYDKDTEGKRNHFAQLEIPQNFLTDYDPVPCDASRGDVILFDRNMVHTSNANLSNRTAFAMVARIWDPSDDLTLSGDMACQPYGRNIGRSNLVVSPGVPQ